MKKFVILPMIAVAALGLAACKKDAPTENAVVANEALLNTDAPIEGNVTEETLNTSVDGNATVSDNATAIDTASNATAK
jgi:hypothetical protein